MFAVVLFLGDIRDPGFMSVGRASPVSLAQGFDFFSIQPKLRNRKESLVRDILTD